VHIVRAYNVGEISFFRYAPPRHEYLHKTIKKRKRNGRRAGPDDPRPDGVRIAVIFGTAIKKFGA